MSTPPPNFLFKCTSSPDFVLRYVWHCLFTFTKSCFHLLFTSCPPPPPPPPSEVQLRFHCQGQVCCRQLRQAAASAQHAATAAAPSCLRPFSQTSLSFPIPPTDFAKEFASQRFLENVSTLLPTQINISHKQLFPTRFLISDPFLKSSLTNNF